MLEGQLTEVLDELELVEASASLESDDSPDDEDSPLPPPLPAQPAMPAAAAVDVIARNFLRELPLFVMLSPDDIRLPSRQLN